MNVPVEFHELASKVSYVKRKSNNEFSSSCPECGGSPHQDGSYPDRFIMLVRSNATQGALAFCRKCGYKWWEGKGQGKELTQEERQKWIEERELSAKKERERAESEYLQVLTMLRSERMWEIYHNNLTEQAKALWRKRGIPDDFQQYWQLGYCPDLVAWKDSEQFHTPSLTIPIFDAGWDILNIRHRLLNPPTPHDKYRPERKGLYAPAFLSDPDLGYNTGKILVVEGEIKAAVAYLELQDPELQVIGITGQQAWSGIASKLEDKDIWLCFDPDVNIDDEKSSVRRCAREVGAKVIDLPKKIDDAILAGMLDKRGIQLRMKSARYYPKISNN